MKKSFFFLLLLLSFSSIIAQVAPYKIESIKAYLFYNQAQAFSGKDVGGQFSENIIDNPGFSLFNTIIGGGSAEGCSEQTLVVVEISGKPEKYISRDVHFSAAMGSKTLLKRKDSFAMFENGKYYISYMLHDVGVGQLKIVVEIKNGKKSESKMSKTINFEGGE